MSLPQRLGIAALSLASLLQGCDSKVFATPVSTYNEPSLKLKDVSDFDGLVWFKGSPFGKQVTVDRKNQTLTLERRGRKIVFTDSYGDGFKHRSGTDRITITDNGATQTYVASEMSSKDFNAALSKFESYVDAVQRRRREMLTENIKY